MGIYENRAHWHAVSQGGHMTSKLEEMFLKIFANIISRPARHEVRLQIALRV